ncbi:LuxR C-terminal-related transcriptional regulator [Streptomyces sp. NPDC058701]|uniref:LuxR C-terminal-related transcriptional regulator n=1 Tax=Streptomyces sp. NPDC058701 TaxID=3346608 RepID=UPI003652BEB0
MPAGDLPSHWPMVGRDDEIEELKSAWGNGRNRILIVSGPAGVGKSRLVDEFLGLLSAQGVSCQRVVATVSAAAVPLGALAHLIPDGADLSDPVRGFAVVAREMAGENHSDTAMLVDDIQLLDGTSAVLLRQLLDAGAVRIIATLRTGHPVPEAVASLIHGDAAHWVSLGELDESCMDKLLQATLRGPVARSALQVLHTAAGGNALYLRELVHAALATDQLSHDGETWDLSTDWIPAATRLSTLVGARMAAVEPEARVALDLLAVCGPLSLGDLEAVAGAATLARLEADALIQCRTARRRTEVSLAHPLYGDILRTMLPEHRRRQLLLQEAERVTSYGARRREDALNIATWRLAATGQADPALLTHAAALARHAHDYRQVVTLLDALLEGHQTVATRLQYGEALVELGQWEDAEKLLADAAHHCGTSEEILAVSVARTMNLLWADAVTEHALAVNDEARTLLSGSRYDRVLDINEALIRTVSGEPVRGLAVLDTALEQDIRQSADMNVWLTGAIMKGMGLASVGRTEEAVRWARHAYAAHVEVNEHALVPHPASQHIALCFALTETGDLSQARRVGEAAYQALLADRAPLPRIWMAFCLGHVEWLAGHPVTARRWFAESVSLSRRQNQSRALNLGLTALASAAAATGDLDTAADALNESRAYQPIGFLAGQESLGLAWVLVAQGDLAGAKAELREGLARARGTGHTAAEALLLTELARLGEARTVHARLDELAEQGDGSLLAVRVRFAKALAVRDPERLMAVAEELSEMGADLLAAEAGAEAASLWHQCGDHRRATAATHHALESVNRCQGVRTPMLASLRNTSTLTDRECEVARLAAVGTTSKAIAETLHLSVRTVDNHLQRIYSKLGVGTRTELPAALGATTVPEKSWA